MKTTKLVVLLVLVVALAAIVLQNTAPVQVSFLWMSGKAPAVLLLFLTASAGFTVGLLVALVRGGAASKE